MFSAGDDKQVKCWDLEQNKVGISIKPTVVEIYSLNNAGYYNIQFVQVIRSYHGHLSGVYCLALHPTLDILLTGGRDSVCRVCISSI